MVDEKSDSWVKHAVRRWKQFYNEIQFVDGQVDTSTPLSKIFRREYCITKLLNQSIKEGSRLPEITPSKKDETSHAPPKKAPPSNPEQKQSKKRFLSKINGLHHLIQPLNFFLLASLVSN